MTRDRILGIVGIVVILLVAVGVVLAVTQGVEIVRDPKAAVQTLISGSDDAANPGDATKRIFTVRSGEPAASIGERLQAAGLIKNALGFRLMAEKMGVAGDLAAGDYELSPSMKPSEILNILAAGKTKPGPLITIPEGWRAEQIAERVSANGIGTTEEFMGLVQAGNSDLPLLKSRPAGASLEGYLFPDSYRTDAKTTSEDLEKRMVAEFGTKFTPDMAKKAAAQGMTIHRIVTLASIIEREAVVPSERPLMAGVFYNRLKDGMKLDTDPTVQYAVASADPASVKQYGWWKTDLTAQDLTIDSPYNTYKYPGLPPGPICDPASHRCRRRWIPPLATTSTSWPSPTAPTPSPRPWQSTTPTWRSTASSEQRASSWDVEVSASSQLLPWECPVL